jgi:hypothetical protein
VQRVKELNQVDRRISVDSVATAPACSHCLSYSIMQDHLKFWKDCTYRVPREPRELKDREKMN